MRDGLRELVNHSAVEATVAGFGSVFLLYFMNPPLESYEDLLRNDGAKFVNYRRALIERGVYELPVNLKRNHISLSHTEADIDYSLAMAAEALHTL
jgi:glutamate-1-semialdehyde 2,1-aminomutase